MPKFKITANFYYELITDWNHARDEFESRRFFINKLAVKMGRTAGSLRIYFAGQKDNLKIQLIKE